MAKKNVWADKVCALVRSGNTDAALAQMRVAPDPKDLKQLRTLLEKSGFLSRPDPKDLKQLRTLLEKSGFLSRHPNLATALDDHLALLSSPRLHRAP